MSDILVAKQKCFEVCDGAQFVQQGELGMEAPFL
jgi:hypothetical protein